MSTVSVLLICGLNAITGVTFLICGYIIGSRKQIITVTKGDKVEHVEHYNDVPDEEASYVTPEMEQVYEAYRQAKKQGEIYGMET